MSGSTPKKRFGRLTHNKRSSVVAPIAMVEKTRRVPAQKCQIFERQHGDFQRKRRRKRRSRRRIRQNENMKKNERKKNNKKKNIEDQNN